MSLLRGFAIGLALTLPVGSVVCADKPKEPEKKEPAPATKPAEPAGKVISLDEFDKARQEKDVVILDVRTPKEFAEGHVPGAINVSVRGEGAEEFDKKVASIDKSKTILVYCRSGVRSTTACEKMKAAGFEKLANFKGSWLEWEKARKPVEK